MYNINILNKCDDEKIQAAIIAAVAEIMTGDGNLVVGKMKRGKIEDPVWNVISRKEILENIF